MILAFPDGPASAGTAQRFYADVASVVSGTSAVAAGR